MTLLVAQRLREDALSPGRRGSKAQEQPSSVVRFVTHLFCTRTKTPIQKKVYKSISSPSISSLLLFSLTIKMKAFFPDVVTLSSDIHYLA